MSVPPSDFSPLDDAIENAAVEWLCEREEGFAPGRADQFRVWCAADSRHQAAVVRTERAMALIAEMPEVRVPLEASLAENVRPEATLHRAFFRTPVWAVGLAAALMLAAGLWWSSETFSGSAQRYVTEAARQQQIALNDGSVVDLNVSSDVSIQLTARERRVNLAAGEAHFAVAHDTGRPFIVTAAGVSVRAVGTAFSVRLGEAGVEVLVTEGKVEITRDAANATAANNPLPRLVAGERTVISRGAPLAQARVERVTDVALRDAIRWHSQMMTFSNLPLREVAEQFNRRNVTRIVITDPVLGERKIGGTFAADQVEAFVRLLERDGDVAAERRGAKEIVLRRAP